MSTFLTFVFGFLLLTMGAWTLVMGGIGTILGPRRHRSRLRGFAYGLVLGPVGWAILCTRPRPISRGRNWATGRLDRQRSRGGRQLGQGRSVIDHNASDTPSEVRDDLRY